MEARSYREAALKATVACPERELAELDEYDPHAVVNNLQFKTKVLADAGHLDMAEKGARGAVAYARMHADIQPTELASCLSNLAAILSQMQRYAESLQLFDDVENLAPQMSDDDAFLFLLNSGQTYMEVGGYTRARELLTHARNLETAADQSAEPRTALYNALGQVELAMNNPKGALEHYESAIRTLEDGEESESLLGAIVHDNMGLCLAMMKRYEESLIRHEQARQIIVKHLETSELMARSHPSVLQNMSNLALALLMMDRLTEAEQLAHEAIELASDLGSLAQGTYITLGWICWADERYREGLNCLLDAAALTDSVLGESTALGTEELRMSYASMAQSELSMLVTLAGAHFANESAQLERVFDVVLRRKSLAGEAFDVQRDAILSGTYPRVQSLLRELSDTRGAIAASALRVARRDLPSIPDDLPPLRERERELEAAIARELPGLHIETKLRDVTSRSVSDSVPADWTLLEFLRIPVFEVPHRCQRPSLDDVRYWAFVLPAEDRSRLSLVDLGSADVIDDLVADFRYALLSSDPQRDLQPLAKHVSQPEGGDDDIDVAGRRLRDAVLGPIAGFLPSVGHVVVAQDSALTRIPFEALPGTAGGHLIDHYTFSYVGTCRDLLRLAHGPRGRTRWSACRCRQPGF